MNNTSQLSFSCSDGAITSGVKLRYMLLSLVLLCTQISALEHTHAGENQPQSDCELCLKLTSHDDVIVSTKALPTATTSSVYAELFGDSLIVADRPTRQARSPPHYS